MDELFALIFILIFLDSHYWCCNGSIPSCCNTRPRDLNCRVATSCIDSLQHSVLSLKFSTIVLQHPVLTVLQDFSIRLNHCCNTSAQPAALQYSGSTTMLQHPVCIAILCLDSAQPPCCNTWSQPAALQYPTHHVAIHRLNIQPSCCNTVLTCFAATIS